MKLYNTVFIFAYYSYKDPIFQSAVLPYFMGLNKLEPKLRFVLLTFEQKQFKLPKSEFAKIKTELIHQNIFWYRTNWNSGKFKMLKKVFDIWQAIFISTFLILKYRIDTIYSEGFPGAVMGHWLAQLFQKKHIVHTFEPHTQYMIEAGVWNKNSWEAKLLSKYELKVAKGADAILTATEAMIEKLNKLKVKASIIRVPSCVDTNVFNYSLKNRLKIRNELGIKDNEIVITILGKFGGMYMDLEAFDFLKVCEDYKGLNFRYFIFTNESKQEIRKKIKLKKLPEDKFLIKFLKREDVSAYLSASDFGLVAVRQHPGKRYCSPIKDGEYWACGLPLIIPKGISDDYLFAKQENIGIVMNNLSHESYSEVCDEIKKWKHFDKNETVERCRSFALKDRDVNAFNKLYSQLFIK